MACVFYEMFSTEDPDEDEDVPDVQNSAPAQEGRLLEETNQLWQSFDIGIGFLIGSIPVMGVIVTWVLANPSNQIVSMSIMDFVLIIPLVPALLITLTTTTTY